MKKISQLMNTLQERIADALQLAVPAVSHRRQIPRWRNLGKPITPYHFMQPVLIPVKNNNNG